VTILAGKPGLAGSVDGSVASALFYGPSGIARDASGAFYVVDADSHTIRSVSCP
jgi:hypothetical protein